MCGDPKDRPHLVYFGTVLRQSADTMVIYANVKVRASNRNSISVIPTMSSRTLITDSDSYQRNPHEKGYLPLDWKEGLPKRTRRRSSVIRKAGALIRRTSKFENPFDEYVRGFFDKVYAVSIREGLNTLMQLSGLGVLRPNVVVMGFKDDWMEIQNHESLSTKDGPPGGGTDRELKEYVGMVQDIINARMGIIILRNMINFD